MGTTRMHDSPRLGVVRRNCQVHGVGILYVAGSSVFPTAEHRTRRVIGIIRCLLRDTGAAAGELSEGFSNIRWPHP